MTKEELKELKNKIAKMSEEEKVVENLKRRSISLGTSEEEKTGYPSIDKPWLKYYTKEQVEFKLPESTCYDVLYNLNKDHLEDTAIDYFGNKISYKELFRNIEKSTKAFQKLGVKKGDIVSFLAIDTPEIIYSFYALNRLGAISNMVDPRSSVNALKKYFNEVESKYVVALDVFRNMMQESLEDTKVEKVIEVSPTNSAPIPVKVLTMIKRMPKTDDVRFMQWNDFTKNGENVFRTADVEYKKDYPATIVHTGGTTGKPKGVLLSNDNLNAVVYQAMNSPLPQNRQDKFLNVTVPFVAFGLALGTHLPMSLGWKSIFIPNFEIKNMRKLMMKYKPQLIMGTQTYFEPMVSYTKFDYKDTKAMLMGGMPTNAEFEKRLNNTIKEYNGSFQVSKGYSMTEATAMGTCSFNSANEPGSDGIPMPKTTIAAFEPDTDCELPYNVIGEICMKSPTIMLGYYKNEEETKKVIRKHSDGSYWIHSGDLGYVTKDGFIYIKDRMKRMIIFSGYKIFPSEIEESFIGHDKVENCSVVAMDDEQNDKVPAAFIKLKNKEVTEEEQELIKEELYNKMDKDGLPSYFRPKEIFVIDEFPITNVGKVDIKALEAKANEYIHKQYTIKKK